MSENSTIEWTDATWNPIVGCTHVSEGCDHCYAAREASGRLSGHPLYARLAKDGKFTGEVRLVPERLEDPLRWRRPRMVFVNSMSDLFHDDVDVDFVAEVFGVMAAARRHTFQVLTKRPGRMASVLGRWGQSGESDVRRRALMHVDETDSWWTWPLPNVWLGTSVESQKWADVRIPQLLRTPAAVRFLSCEPLLGPVDLLGRHTVPALGHDDPGVQLDAGYLGSYIGRRDSTADVAKRERSGIGWVIVGGESGPGARPMHPDWAWSLRDQCVAAGVPFFFKQWGEWGPGGRGDLLHVIAPDGTIDPPGDHGPPYGRHETDTGSLLMSRVGKKAAGRQLDHRTWDEMPVRSAQ